ncbi:MAG: Smr/MutS family protein [Pseudomonadota bacterium]
MRWRTLSAEERALWSRVAQTATPLHKRSDTGAATATGMSAGPPDPDRPSAARREDAAKETPTQRPSSAKALGPASGGPKGVTETRLAPKPVTPLGPSTPGLDRRTAERLRRGRIAPDARIDLHGHTLERAHTVCAAFIHREHARGSRCVLVITGKGRRRRIDDGASLQGVLRDAVPRWLQLPPLAPLVVGVYPASQRHGGGGAFYVYLRRAR